jgi:hypothetical protein
MIKEILFALFLIGVIGFATVTVLSNRAPDAASGASSGDHKSNFMRWLQ